MKQKAIMLVVAVLCLNFGVKAQEKLKGRVVDATTQQPLSGAKVTEGKQTVAANNEGYFELKLSRGKYTIHIHYLGYETKDLAITLPLTNDLIIPLTANSKTLEEVEINAGYYTVKDRERTGSISRITYKDIEKLPITNPLQALQGRVPGLEITQLSGLAGGGFKVRIRGENSILSGNEPLYIVDGNTYPSTRINNSNSNAILENSSPLNLLNPNDIESIEVLKDADATAIYGSRGANGVILITTKKGAIGETKINVALSHGMSRVAHRLDLMNTQEYIAMRLEAFKNDGLSPGATDYDVNGVWDKNKYTDWQDVLIGGTAHSTNGLISVSGGDKNSNYLVSSNYYKEGTVFPGNFGFKRASVHTSLNFGSATSKLHLSLSATYSRTVNTIIPSDPTSFIAWAPNSPDLYNEYGKLTWNYNNAPLAYNPMSLLLNTIDATTDNLIGNAIVKYQILKHLSLKTSLGYTKMQRDELGIRPNIARDPATNPQSTSRQSQFGNNYNNSWIAESILSYDSKLAGGTLNALVGMSFQQNISEFRNITASNFSSDELMKNMQSAAVFSVSEMSYANYKYSAFFARINYSLADKYFLNLTGRRDGSSRFGPDNRFANFGAFGASWLFSEERVLKNNFPILSFGKLRASYGITGNDQISDYQYMQVFASTPSYQDNPTISINRIANPDYAWETNYKAEAALQLGFFKDKINLQIAYFRNLSSNQLALTPLPPSVGGSGIYENIPAVVRNVGWEFEGTIKLLGTEDWSWSSSLNLSIPKNKLVAFPNLENTAYAISHIIGRPLAIKRYYNTYVDAASGVYSFLDIDGNGLRNDADRYLNQFFGQFYYGGLQNSIRYKKFNLDVFISYTNRTGNSSLNITPYVPGYFVNGVPTNQSRLFLDRWQKPGDKTDVPKFSTTSANNTNFALGRNQGIQSIGDVSYARLKNVSLSYALPQHWLSRVHAKSCEVNVQGQNIFTLTRYKGLDPEIQTTTRLPPLRTFLLGLKLTI